MGNRILTSNQFTEHVPQKLVDALSQVNKETDDLCRRANFCREHGFHKEAEWIQARINERSSVYVDICNALGLFF